MAKIELTDLELKVLKQLANETFSATDATTEELKAATSVVDKYTDYETEMNAYEASGAFPMKWFLKEYQKQAK